ATLNKELSKPINVIAGLGPAALTKQLDTLTQAGDANNEKLKRFGARFVDFVLRSAPGGAGVIDKASKEKAQEFAEREAAISKLRAESELKIANLKLQEVVGEEKQVKLAEIILAAEEKRSELQLQRANDPNLQKSLSAINTEEKAARFKLLSPE